MIRRALLGLALAAMACGQAHLGPSQGKRARSALNSQVAQSGGDPETIDSREAEVTMTKFRGAPAATGQTSTGATTSVSVAGGPVTPAAPPAGVETGPGGVPLGSSSPIRLEAK